MPARAVPAAGEPFLPFRKFKGCLIPETLLRRAIGRGPAMLYGQLARYSAGSGLCFPGQATLARDFGVTERTIQRWLKILIDERLLRSARRGLGTRSNAYEFLWHPALYSAQLDFDFPALPAGMMSAAPVENPVNLKTLTRQKCRVSLQSSLSEKGQLDFVFDTGSSRDGGKVENRPPDPEAVLPEFPALSPEFPGKSRSFPETLPIAPAANSQVTKPPRVHFARAGKTLLKSPEGGKSRNLAFYDSPAILKSQGIGSQVRETGGRLIKVLAFPAGARPRDGAGRSESSPPGFSPRSLISRPGVSRILDSREALSSFLDAPEESS